MFFAFYGMPVSDVPPPVAALAASDGPTWGQLERLLVILRREKPDITVGMLQVFLHIARRVGGLEQPYIKSVAEAVGMQYSTAARICDLLSDGVGNSSGLGWIAKTEERTSRAKYLTLTNGGAYILAAALEETGKGEKHEN